MSGASLESDRAWCRGELPRVSRTFALNIRLLDRGLLEAVRTGYLLCRVADTLEDSWPGAPEEIAGRFDLLVTAMAGRPEPAEALARAAAAIPGAGEDLRLVAGFPRVWRVWRALPEGDRESLAECVRTMAAGMRRYAVRAAARPPGAPYLDTEAELHDYCWVVAGCVGVMLTRLFTARVPAADAAEEARRFALAPVVGEALQLTNVLLDWPADVRRGRCHVPASWLAERRLAPADLVGTPRPEVRELADRLESLARRALARVPDYLDTVPASAWRYRLFCLWPTRWALESLRHARKDPEFPWGPRRPKLPRRRLWSTALASLFGHRNGALEPLRAAEARA